MNKFEEMWYELKNSIEEDLKFHRSGENAVNTRKYSRRS